MNKDNRYSLDLAISGCTAVIQGGRETQKNLAIAFYDRGNAYEDKHDYGRALADFTQAIQLNPRYADAFNNRGNANRHLKNYDGALADFNEAIRQNPRDPVPFNNRGLVYADQNDYDRAIGDYNEAIRLNPRYVLALNNRGNAYVAKPLPSPTSTRQFGIMAQGIKERSSPADLLSPPKVPQIFADPQGSE